MQGPGGGDAQLRADNASGDAHPHAARHSSYVGCPAWKSSQSHVGGGGGVVDEVEGLRITPGPTHVSEELTLVMSAAVGVTNEVLSTEPSSASPALVAIGGLAPAAVAVRSAATAAVRSDATAVNVLWSKPGEVGMTI